MKLLIVSIVVFLLNLPFGYWRSKVRRLSLRWFLSIHLPIPLIIAIRIFSGLGYRPVTIPVVAGAFFAGQFIGSRLGRRLAGSSPG